MAMLEAMHPDHRAASAVSPRRLLVTICLGESLVQFGLTSVAAITPALTTALALGGQEASLLLTSYLLPLAGALLVAGRLGDLLGHRRVFGLGAALYAGAAVAAALAPGFAVLVGARAVQGLGAAMVSGNNLAIVARGVAEDERPRAIAIVAAVGLLAGITGSAVGSVAAMYFGWQWLFVFVAPLAIWTAKRALSLPATEPAKVDIDWIGAALLATVTTMLAVALNHPHTTQSETVMPLYHTYLPASAALVALLFVAHERRVKSPLLEWRHLRDRTFALAVGSNFALHVTMMSIFYLGPIIAVGALGGDALAGALIVIAGQVGMLIAALAVARAPQRFRRSWTRPAGGLVIATGLVGWAAAAALSNYALALGFALFAGLGAGAMVATTNNVIMGLLPAHAKGVASGMIETTRQFGHNFGVTIPTAILAFVGAGSIQHGAAASCLAMAGVMVLGAGLAALSHPTGSRWK